MGRRGPAPKPTVLKLAAGNPGKRPIDKTEPVPDYGAPDPPEWLSEDARKCWDYIVPGLSKCGIARRIDGVVLGRYCTVLVRWIKTKDFLEKNDSVYPVKNKAGRVIASREFPQAGEFRKLAKDLLQYEREFGLTAAARTRIQVEWEKKSKDPGGMNELRKQFQLGIVRPA